MRYVCLLIVCVFLVSCFPQQEGSSDNSDNSQKPQKILVNIQGTLRYQDRLYNQLGFLDNAQVFHTVRRAPIAIANEQGEIVAQTITSELGIFDFSDIPEGDYLFRVEVQSTLLNGTTVRVKDPNLNLYVIEVPITVSAEQTQYNVDMLVQDRVAGLFNMLDVFYSALQFVDAVSGNSVSVDDLNVYWKWGSSEGSYTCRSDNVSCEPGIYVLSDPLYSGDTDEFDDDVLLHEFGHHLESSLYLRDSPGGAHTLHSTTLDMRLSWSEGMASAFAASVKQWLRQNDPGRMSVPNYVGLDLADYYIDTRGSGVGVSLDIRQASPTVYHYATNEVAVASLILGLQTLTSRDTVWQSLITALTSNSTADTLESFWDGLVGYNGPSTQSLSSWQSLLAQRDIFYQLDSLESDQSMASARPIDDTLHSLYRNHYTVDVDWHLVNVVAGTQYLFETYALINGADTYLELFDANEQLLLTNDDTVDCENQPGGCSPLHDGSNFSSSITYSPSVDETVYLKVSTAPAVYDNPTLYGYIGRYGGYQIRVTEQP